MGIQASGYASIKYARYLYTLDQLKLRGHSSDQQLYQQYVDEYRTLQGKSWNPFTKIQPLLCGSDVKPAWQQVVDENTYNSLILEDIREKRGDGAVLTVPGL